MQGTISFDGTLSGGITGGGGGGSEVAITPVLTEGTKIADYSIDGESGSLYAPEAEPLPSTIVTKTLRKYNDDTQTKILTITTLDTENSQEVSQDIYAPSPVDCWYTPGLEQDYEIGKFTYGGVTQNVYIPYFQRPLTAGTNITIDQNNVISASSGGGVNYSTTEQDTGLLWLNGEHIYQKTVRVDLGTSQDSNSASVGITPDTIIGFDFIINFQGFATPAYYNAANEFINYYYNYSEDKVYVRKNSASIPSSTAYITLKYTKSV